MMNVEEEMELLTADRIQYRPIKVEYSIPVVTSERIMSEYTIGYEFETDHPDQGECKVEVTDGYHSEKKIRRLIKEETTIVDWMKAKIWRLKRRYL